MIILDLQIGSIVARRGLYFAAPVLRLGKIVLGIRLTGVDIDRALPAINGLIAVPQALCQKPIIHQRSGVTWPVAKHLLVLRIPFRFPSCLDQASPILFSPWYAT